ncbi:MAG: C40 family peptidase [Rhizobiales bacterium]|nr:C40 family peptidase [Hyphomicrobiales bacterium]
MNGVAIAALARGWIDTRYRHQASLKGIGCDCLGLVRGVWRETLGPEPQAVPAYSPDWAEAGLREDLLDAARRHMIAREAGSFEAGDVLLFRWRAYLPAKHAAIAVSSDRMVHAQEGARVCEVAVNSWWRRHLAGAFAFPLSPSPQGGGEEAVHGANPSPARGEGK